MQIKPVIEYKSPHYPTKDQVLADPQLLRMIPRRWWGKPAVCAALIFTITSGLCACGDSDKIDEAKLDIPLFNYGDGISAYGCESVVPPVYLSEAEAAQIIREEALKEGIDFERPNGENAFYVKSDNLPVTSINVSYFRKDKTEKTRSGKLKLDGYDASLGIGFEFVSQKDVVRWQDKNEGVYSTVEEYDMKDTAQRLNEAVSNVAVFYDPSVDYDFYKELYKEDLDSEERKAKALQQQKEQLRKQVCDFLQWLAGEGII